MRRVCAWCGVDLAPNQSSDPNLPVTHGICPPCAAAFVAEDSGPLRLFLDSLGVPVLLVDNDARVLAASERAGALLGLERDALPGRQTGEVLGCGNAHGPGGCGRQAPCLTCTIRASVRTTWATGRSVENATALADVPGAEAPRLAISTERIGHAVLLRIDEPDPTADEPPPSGE